jgi:hypothetical protein
MLSICKTLGSISSTDKQQTNKQNLEKDFSKKDMNSQVYEKYIVIREM